MHVIDPSKHKLIIVSVATLVSFFGLQAAGRALDIFQLDKFWLISAYVYLFLVFWQSFVFDLHLRTKSIWKGLAQRFDYFFEGHHGAHYANYLVLPTVIYWSAVTAIFLNPFDVFLKSVFALGASVALAVSFWYLKTVFYGHDKTHRAVRQLIFIIKLFASYAGFTALFATGRYFGWDGFSFAVAVFMLTYALIHQAFFQHHYLGHNEVQMILLAGLVIAEFSAIIFEIWNVNYYSGALAISAVYNAVWGLLQHKFIEKNLSREIVYEYFAVLFVILVIIFSTTNFSERIY